MACYRCSKELNQWDLLLEFANSKGNTNPQLVLESAWRVPNWPLMKDALTQVELSCPKELAWKVNLYRGYLAICHPEEHHLNLVCHGFFPSRYSRHFKSLLVIHFKCCHYTKCINVNFEVKRHDHFNS